MDTNDYGLKYSLHHSMFDREADGDNKSRLAEEFGLWSDTKPPSHWLVLVLPPGQDAVSRICFQFHQLFRSRLTKEFVPKKMGPEEIVSPSLGVTHHRLVLVLPPGQDASRSSVEWNACHRPKSSAVPTVRLPFPPSLVVRFFHRERRKPARPTYREEEAPSINKSVSHRWWTRTDVPRMSLVSRTSFMTRSVTKL